MESVSIKIQPSTLKGTVYVPPSKSLLHRAIIAASLAKGKSIIRPFTPSDDINATLNAMIALGVSASIEGETLTLKSPGYLKKPKKSLFMHDSGSTLRFLIPLVSLINKPVKLTMSAQLATRPIDIYESIFKEHLTKNDTVITLDATLKPGVYKLSNLISSQFVSGLLFSLPLLSKDSKIMIDNYVSKPYIDLTVEVLNHYGVIIKKTHYGYYIKGNQTYTAGDIFIEGDYSQAAFFFAYAAIKSPLTIEPLSPYSLQADKMILTVLKKMGAKLIQSEAGYHVMPSPLKGITVDLNTCPDLAPILALLAVFAKGKTILKNTERLRFKESNRITSTLSLLSALGVSIKEKDNTIEIKGTYTLEGNLTIDSANDHRIAMMGSIAACLAEQPIIITNPYVVSKSFPTFYNALIDLGATIEDVI